MIYTHNALGFCWLFTIHILSIFQTYSGVQNLTYIHQKLHMLLSCFKDFYENTLQNVLSVNLLSFSALVGYCVLCM